MDSPEAGFNSHTNLNPLLDIIVTNIPTIVAYCRTLAPLSDHCPVVTALSQSKPPPTCEPHKHHRCIDYSRLRCLIEQEPFLECITGGAHIDARWMVREAHFRYLVARSSTFQRIDTRRKCIWYTSELHRLKQGRDRLFRSWLRTPYSIESRTACRLARISKTKNFVKPEIRRSIIWLQPSQETDNVEGMFGGRKSKILQHFFQKTHQTQPCSR